MIKRLPLALQPVWGSFPLSDSVTLRGVWGVGIGGGPHVLSMVHSQGKRVLTSPGYSIM